jgi:chromate transporter
LTSGVSQQDGQEALLAKPAALGSTSRNTPGGSKENQDSKPGVLSAFWFWFTLGWMSFGGAGTQVSLMYEEFVEKRRWISPHRFTHALSYCMILPGPEAQQLSIYLGWLMHGPLAGIIAGLLFLIPSFLIMTAFGGLYVLYGQIPELQALLYGLKPAILAIVLSACIRLGQRVLMGKLWWVVMLISMGLLQLGASFVTVIVAAGLLGWIAYLFSSRPITGLPESLSRHTVAHQPPAGQRYKIAQRLSDQKRETQVINTRYMIDDDSPRHARAELDANRIFAVLGIGIALWLLAYGALVAYAPPLLAELAAFFSRVALVSFGSSYAVLPYLFDTMVDTRQWVSSGQIIDGLAISEITPGPLTMISTFLGYLASAQHPDLTQFPIATAGLMGAVVVTVFLFLPSFIFVLAGAPWIEAARRIPSLIAPLTAISAASVALIFDLALIFAKFILWPTPTGDWGSFRTLDLVAGLISALAIVLMLQFRMGMVITMLICISLGVVASALGLP